MSTVTYVTDDNSPLTPNASLVLSRMGDDAEEAWLRSGGGYAPKARPPTRARPPAATATRSHTASA